MLIRVHITSTRVFNGINIGLKQKRKFKDYSAGQKKSRQIILFVSGGKLGRESVKFLQKKLFSFDQMPKITPQCIVNKAFFFL